MVNKGDTSNVTDRCKPRRERVKTRKILSFSSTTQKVDSLCFDKRKDSTKINIKKGYKYYRSTVVEEHFVIQVLGSKHLGHMTLPTDLAISMSLVSLLSWIERLLMTVA